jgi:hypothetical protein
MVEVDIDVHLLSGDGSLARHLGLRTINEKAIKAIVERVL